jgi:RsiW-degrading membrane proteinase PrsW (M82 family)
MNFSLLQFAFVILAPVCLAVFAWRKCGPDAPLWLVACGFFFGGLIAWPVIRFGDFIALAPLRPSGHYYFDELIEMFFTTALPEEMGKGLVALGMLRIGRHMELVRWLMCGAVAHSGFAVHEGIFGMLGGEGVLKSVIGRSMGAMSHCSWGIIGAWFFWKGWRSGRWANWLAGLIVPALLHALTNASLVEVPGADGSADQMPSAEEVLVVLSGIVVFVVSIGWAALILIRSRKTGPIDRSRFSGEASATA